MRVRGLTPVAFLTPALVLFFSLVVGPLLYSLAVSLADGDLLSLVSGSDHYVGLANYRLLAMDGSFWRALGRLAVFASVSSLLELIVATGAAVYLTQVVRVPKVVETLLVLPLFVLPVVSGLLFRYLLDPLSGLIGAVYAAFGQEAPGLLGDPRWALAALIVQDLWRQGPLVFLLVYSGLTALPQEPIEAVKLDGANLWQTFRYVLWPLLRGTVAVAGILKLIESLKAFTEIYVMTGGGPGTATELLPLYIVKQTFVFFRFGYGAAASCVVLGLGLLAAGVWLITKRGVAR